ncbi:mechanosensitive ion channel family protein [Candidatus Woesearchaeota archaeon]|nr:mechanosensitive ion channel family protein [Candidatus Woesearchaeota archaeon]
MALDYASIRTGLEATSYLGNTMYDYVLFLLIFAGITLALKMFELSIFSIIKKLAKKSKTKLDDMLIDIFESLRWPFFFFIALYFAIKTISVHELINKGVDAIIVITLGYYTIKSLNTIITFFSRKEIKKRQKEDKKTDISFLKVMTTIVKGVVWVIGAMFILQNLGIEITPLIASVGIGGIAIAFALQNILSDLFSSFSIYFDKPFGIGDFIVIGSDMGNVEHIGIKTTRIKTLQGQELIVSNTELTSTRVNNYKRMEKRRIVVPLGVVYQTSSKKLERIPKMINDVFKTVKGVTLDRVHFKSYGDFSLNFEIVYYVNTGDYLKYMDANQEINLKIFKAFEKEKIGFAYPTQTVFLEK